MNSWRASYEFLEGLLLDGDPLPLRLLLSWLLVFQKTNLSREKSLACR
jgi:hypothetical protein